MIYFLIGLIVAARSIFIESQSLDYYIRTKWYHYSLTFLFNFILWPITVVMMIIMKRYTVNLDREFLKKRYVKNENQ